MAVAVAIDPRRVIEHARDLARHQSGAGRPRSVWLRRAVSAAYYAVFHAFAVRIAGQVLPQGSAVDQQRLTRSLEHAALREVCQRDRLRITRAPPRARQEAVNAMMTTLRRSNRNAGLPEFPPKVRVVQVMIEIRDGGLVQTPVLAGEG